MLPSSVISIPQSSVLWFGKRPYFSLFLCTLPYLEISRQLEILFRIDIDFSLRIFIIMSCKYAEEGCRDRFNVV